MLSVILNVLCFVSIPAGPFTYSEAVFASTHNSYSGDLDTETAAGVFSIGTTSGIGGTVSTRALAYHPSSRTQSELYP